jgi:hypothetical protein
MYVRNTESVHVLILKILKESRFHCRKTESKFQNYEWTLFCHCSNKYKTSAMKSGIAV